MGWFNRFLGITELELPAEPIEPPEASVRSEPARLGPLPELSSLADCCVGCGKPAHDHTHPYHHSAFERADDKRSDYLVQRARFRKQADDPSDTTARSERLRAELARDEADDPRGFKAVPPQCDACFRTDPCPTPRYCDRCGSRYEQPHGSGQNKCNACAALS